ncbi:metalloprotease family [Plasmopara halstedii]|uniref:Metalloprotease family n=1 Tax=Plasmopara halstedii TaxID=4781 RepID=A0A0P1AFE4_PLAHL|nr:metalloprotease family [Plasmopara halstedii]CEG39330.1 metalloprotease family [Plasmopara halstedii]|eukprot:XP_024575699.1 metalloprotease family [Plasmopara halstedii]
MLEPMLRISGQIYQVSLKRAWSFLICSKVITAHQHYNLLCYRKEREWVQTQAEAGSRLFDAILDGMEAEELEYLEYENSLKMRQDSVTDVANMTGLEERLRAIRLRKSVERPNEQTARVAERDDVHVITESTRNRSRVHKALRPHQKKLRQTVLYPVVGKVSSMTANTGQQSYKYYLAPPFSRQRSQEAIANLTCGKIRSLDLPAGVISQFTVLASPNTNQSPYGIETCGILAGVLHGQKLIVTTLIIPKQEGTSDMCNMTNEEELFDFCYNNELLTLGWIHTHPKQACFLSSVDVHTQCGFQSILPEAVAIVVAPSDPNRNVGVFRLTEPSGLQLIQNCNMTGFHAHPSDIKIYSDAFECNWMEQVSAQLVDMR